MEWASAATGLLWRGALGAIPLVIIVAMICRVFGRRPATRHALWVAALLWLLVAPFLPAPPSAESMSGATGLIVASDISPTEPPDGFLLDVGDLPWDAFPSPDDPLDGASPRDDEEGEAPNDLAAEAVEFIPTPRWTLPTRSESEGPTDAREEWPAMARLAPSLDSTPWDRRVADRASSFESKPSPSCVEPSDLHGELTPDPGPDESTALPWHEPPPGKLPVNAPILVLSEVGDDLQIFEQLILPDDGVEPRPICETPCPGAPEVAAATLPQPEKNDPCSNGSVAAISRPAVAMPDSIPYTPHWPKLWREWMIGLAGVRDAVGRLPSFPVSLWLVGSVLIAAGVTGRKLLFLRQLKGAGPAPPAVQAMVQRVAKRLGLAHPPETLMVDRCVSPLICCKPRPRLVLPKRLWAELDDGARQAILCHELAHLRRGDHWILFGDLIIGVLYWWHPLVWWIRHRIHDEADICCDAWVTWLMPESRRAYAEALLCTKQFITRDRGADPGVGLGATTVRAKRFARRISMVMTERTKPGLPVSGFVLALLVLGAGWLASPALSDPPAANEADVPEPLAIGATTSEASAAVAAPAAAAGLAASGGRSTPDAPSAAGGTTYEAYAARKAGGRAGVSSQSTGQTYVPKFIHALGGTVGIDDDDEEDEEDDLEERIERLEQQLEMLNEFIKRLSEAIERGGVGHELIIAPPPQKYSKHIEKKVKKERKVTKKIKKQKDKGECKKHKGFIVTPPDVRPPEFKPPEFKPPWFEPPVPPVPPMPPMPPIREMLSGETIVKKYCLPKGKLGAFTKMMVRPDVPILVSPGKDCITIHATPCQHQVIGEFLRMIHPEGKPGKEIGLLHQLYRDREVADLKERELLEAMLAQAESERANARQLYDEAYSTLEQLRLEAKDYSPGQFLSGHYSDTLKAYLDRVMPQDCAEKTLDELGQFAEQGRLHELVAGIARNVAEQRAKRLADTVTEEALRKHLEEMADEESDRIDRIMDFATDRAMDTVERQAENIERQARLFEERAEAIERRAESIESHVSEVMDRAKELSGRNAEAALSRYGAALAAEAAALEAEAEMIEQAVEELERVAESILERTKEFIRSMEEREREYTE